ncbi:hypothetical protein [Nocardia sp. XZ_19_385]|uniref:hypothetical protein n=1 Tax=Nocardia sp. XZ_19_385 TaxID=2769488 RepID=UPI00188F14D5|nr:hypothetical protein [Nocardia sp. XZ_19_385]
MTRGDRFPREAVAATVQYAGTLALGGIAAWLTIGFALFGYLGEDANSALFVGLGMGVSWLGIGAALVWSLVGILDGLWHRKPGPRGAPARTHLFMAAAFGAGGTIAFLAVFGS